MINIERKAVSLVPEEISVRYTAMPLFIVHDTLTVAMANPLDLIALEDLELVSKHLIDPVVAAHSEVADAIEKYYGE